VAAGGITAAGLGGIARANSAGSGGQRLVPRRQSATAEQVAAAVAQLEPLINDALATTGVPGLSIAVVHQDSVAYINGFGVRSIDAPEPVDADTVFQLASVSKTLAATTVAAVVGDGVLSWDDRIVDLRDDFQLSDPWVTREVTIRDCFSHRTGMFGTAGDDLEQLGFDRETIIYQMRYLNLTGKFRQTYSYSNFGLTLGADSAAVAAGSTWEDLAEERLYAPLGMASTSSRHADFLARENRAELHVPVNGVWEQKFDRQPDPQSPAGGVSSNATDLVQWVRLLLRNGSLGGMEQIDPAALSEMFMPQISRGMNPIYETPSFYGLGWSIAFDGAGRIYHEHAGAFSVGARTYVSLLPEEDLGVVVLANAFPTGVPEAIAYSFYDLLLEGAITKDWSAIWGQLYASILEALGSDPSAAASPVAGSSPALERAAYAGRYTNDYFGELTIDAGDDGQLQLSVGTGPSVFPLEPMTRDVFLFRPSLDVPNAVSAATFTIGRDGIATNLLVEAFDAYGQGTFNRANA
jgi:CubicO group peptidase (beta-lactamase class C family)